ncbi:BRISC and BRCA1-A complex member 1 [Rhynchospora pubera]|uniref:BRISC and BRCA1-A complex member 1 n=1 Tax=Rhynchospora pubera TaxID=906938 RepID=A0AAV8C0J8_9POAL|nr:BRISC and BRCA1-A complex member 1 [Rhynchospora pubera]
MGGGATEASTAPPYSLPPSLFMPEDILFCVDIGPESGRQMRVSGPKGNNVKEFTNNIKSVAEVVGTLTAPDVLSEDVDITKLFEPGPDNCPQLVYDALGDAAEQVSEHVSYIFETGQGLTRILFRHMCILLAHPIQRCAQDDIDMPKPVVKRVLPGGGDGTMGEERAVISNLFKH